LKKLSNQIAHALIPNRVVSGDPHRDLSSQVACRIASIFGVMKAAACYVPIDPNAPGLRVGEIARQCSFRALITSSLLY